MSDYSGWLIDTLQSIGITSAGNQLTWHDLRGWSELSGVQLSIWELETMRYLSGQYLASLHEYATNKDAQAPLQTIASQSHNRARVAGIFSKLRNEHG